MESTRSHLLFTKQQRGGILFLILLIAASLTAYFFIKPIPESLWDLDSPEIIYHQQKLDSLRVRRLEKEQKIYPFNPNFLTDYKAYTLGVGPQEFDRIKDYRDEGKWINSSAEFQKVSGISDSLLKVISPLFKFPEWVNRPKKFSENGSKKFKGPTGTLRDLNLASKEDLMKVRGIGQGLGDRILVMRERVGGFRAVEQLYAVYGLKEEVIAEMRLYFEVKQGAEIAKMNINLISASDIATIPGISFELAQDIWEFRRLREGIERLEELKKIEGLSESKFRLIELYLFAE